MNVLRATIILALLLHVIPSPTVQAQWSRMLSLSEIVLNDLEISASGIMYAVPYGRDEFFVSPDGGDSWELQTIPDTLSILNIEVNGEDLYLEMALDRDNYRLFRSSDRGRTLTEIPTRGLQPGFCVDADGKLYAWLRNAEDEDSVFITNDHGVTWSALAPSIDGFTGWPPLWQGEDALTVGRNGVLWTITEDVLARFDKQSGTWVTYTAGVDEYNRPPSVYHLPNGDLYLNSWFRLMKYVASADSVAVLYDWEAGDMFDHMGFTVTEDGRLLICHRMPIGNHKAIMESLDDGISWRIADSTLMDTYEYFGEYGGRIFASYNYTLQRSPDGISFEECTNGLSKPCVADFETRGQQVHVMAGRYALSSDGGASWDYRGTWNGTNPNAMQMTSDGTMYEDRYCFRVSRDSSRTWEYPFEMPISDFIALDDVVLVAINDSTIIRSTDQGRTFTRTYSGKSVASTFREQQGMLYALGESFLLRSADRGATWEELPLPELQRYTFRNLLVNNRVVLFTNGFRVWTSHTHGESWEGRSDTQLRFGLVNVAVNSDGTMAGIICRAYSQFRFTQDVVLSTDDGLTWHTISSGLPESFFIVSWEGDASRIGFTQRNRLLVSDWYHGLYSFDQVPVSVRSVPPIDAPELLLWPTPARDRVNWRVRCGGNVRTVVVLDASGKQIAECPGSDGIGSIDLSAHPDGVYFLQVSLSPDNPGTPARILTRRLVVLR